MRVRKASLVPDRSAGGRLSNYITPMEVKWMAEVFKSAAGMNREEANRIIKVLLVKYEDKLKTPPDGQSIFECYDVKTMTPSEEYVAFYKVMKQELIWTLSSKNLEIKLYEKVYFCYILC